MKFRTSLPDSPEINLTALIDVVFLLLIFFMVSTTFDNRSELNIQLPEASARASTGDEAVVDIVIDAGGSVHVGGRRLDPDAGTLRRALASAVQGLDSPQVVISADARTPYQSVVTVMDAARQAGLHKLTFAAQHSGMQHSGTQHSGMQHSGMQHSGMQHSGAQHSGTQHSGEPGH